MRRFFCTKVIPAAFYLNFGFKLFLVKKEWPKAALAMLVILTSGGRISWNDVL
jgi:hypothetical protein